jgi:hypothetical protein
MAEQQQALDELTPPWTFRLAESAWGIDPSTKRISLGMVSGRGVGEEGHQFVHGGPVWADRLDGISVRGDVAVAWRTLALAPTDSIGRKLNYARRRLVPWLELHRDDPLLGSPSLVMVEEPFGGPHNQPHPHSFFMLGLMLEALYEVLGVGAMVYTVSPTGWKRPALGAGRGNAKKPALLHWANRHLGYTGVCPHCRGMLARPTTKCGGEPAHDEADALGIAVAASMLLTERRG